MDNARATSPQNLEPPAHIIQQNLACIICNQNLIGQPESASCPGCGRPVSLSVNEDLNRAAPAWLRYQARTMIWLIALCLYNYNPRNTYSFDTLVTALISVVLAAAVAYACWR